MKQLVLVHCWYLYGWLEYRHGNSNHVQDVVMRSTPVGLRMKLLAKNPKRVNGTSKLSRDG